MSRLDQLKAGGKTAAPLAEEKANVGHNGAAAPWPNYRLAQCAHSPLIPGAAA